MSVPRTKRQFAGAAADPAQRQITSFFRPSATTPPPFNTNIAGDVPSIVNLAEASVQANLLSVGMRVRKAVPEGYKTGGYSAFTLWDERNHVVADTANSRSRPNPFSTSRELLPFCGLNKVGGFATQPEPSWTGTALSCSQTLVDSMDDMPGLTLSQETVDSNDPADSENASAKTRKRFFADEEDEEEQPHDAARLGVGALSAWQDGEVSPRSLAPAGWSNGRVMALPRKSRLRGKITERGTPMDTLGQENVTIANMDDDFEEAGFLDRSFEVEMGGV
jgi:hypothetical protein